MSKTTLISMINRSEKRFAADRSERRYGKSFNDIHPSAQKKILASVENEDVLGRTVDVYRSDCRKTRYMDERVTS